MKAVPKQLQRVKKGGKGGKKTTPAPEDSGIAGSNSTDVASTDGSSDGEGGPVKTTRKPGKKGKKSSDETDPEGTQSPDPAKLHQKTKKPGDELSDDPTDEKPKSDKKHNKNNKDHKKTKHITTAPPVESTQGTQTGDDTKKRFWW